MKTALRYLFSLLISVCLVFGLAIPAFAIGNPTTIGFASQGTGKYAVFNNTYETGDMLIMAEGFVYYSPLPSETASSTFIFQLLNVAGGSDNVIASVPLVSYGDRPISIYLSAARVLALGLVTGTAYRLRITGNPLVFATLTEGTNMKTATLLGTVGQLIGGDYMNQAIASDNSPLTNPLRVFSLVVATNIQKHDNPAPNYIIPAGGLNYLSSASVVNTQTVSTTVYGSATSGNATYSTTAGSQNTTTVVQAISGSSSFTSGADIFLAGVPSLNVFCPSLFQSSSTPMNAEQPTSTGAYALTLTPLAQLGPTIANGLTNIGVWLSIGQAGAGWLMIMIIAVMIAIAVYKKTESGLAVLAIGATTPYAGVFLGLMSMPLAFIITLMIVILMGFYFLRLWFG